MSKPGKFVFDAGDVIMTLAQHDTASEHIVASCVSDGEGNQVIKITPVHKRCRLIVTALPDGSITIGFKRA
jgi:hypothetical protein